jgi:signal transduction histidine kinase/ligand-binding sensor domain-containing protein/DNA-binding response OmpR family regulator
MWFGTRDGLNQYDGYKIITYRYISNDSTSLSNNIVNDIIEDKAGNLLIATNKGLSKWIRITRNFVRYDAPKSSLKVSDLCIDSKGRFWAGTVNAGLQLFNPEIGTFRSFLQKHPRANDVHKILEFKEDILWIANKAGLDQFDLKTEKFTTFDVDPDNSKKLPGNTVRDIYRDSKGTIWLGIFRVGLAKYNEKEKSFTTFRFNPRYKSGITDPLIWAISEGRAGELWLGTETKGICVFNPKTNTSFAIEPKVSDPSGLNHQWVRAILKDQVGNIWVGTKAGGINLLSKTREKFQHINDSRGLNNKYVLAINEDPQHRIWLGTDGGGITIFDPVKNTFSYLKQSYGILNSISSNFVYALDNIQNKAMAIGHAQDQGLDLLYFGSGKISNYPSDKNLDDPSKLSGRIISAITVSNPGQLWLATQGGGINILNLHTGTYKKFKRKTEVIQPLAKGEIPNNVVLCVLKGKNENFWIGTEIGLCRFQHNTQRFFNVPLKNTQEPNVNCLYEDATGLWIGTSQGLIHLAADNRQKRYLKENGLPSDVIKSILPDKHGNLWLGTNTGLSRFSPRSGKFLNFGISDGLQADEFNAGSAFVTSNGTMYFGGVNGFNFFHPDSLNFNRNPPPVVLTNLLLANKEVHLTSPGSPLSKAIAEASEIELSYQQGAFITFEFSALDYAAPEKNQYAYRMEGFDNDWHYVGQKREATYTNLSPGEYTFLVKASNNDGIWNEKGASVKVIIEPPFWLSAWAYLAYLGIVSGGLYFIFIQVKFRERLKNEVHFQRMTSEKMQEMSQMRVNFFTNISHELRTPLSLIADPLRRIVSGQGSPEEVKNYSVVAYKNVKRLQKLINQLLDFQKLEAGQTILNAQEVNISLLMHRSYESFQFRAAERNINYTLSLPETTIYAFADEDKLEKVVFNLVSNAFKYTPENGEIGLTLLYHADHNLKGSGDLLEIRISDTGPGIPEEHLEHIFEPFFRISEKQNYDEGASGIGLAFTRELVHLHNGTIRVESLINQGSLFIVSIPLAALGSESGNKPYARSGFDPKIASGEPDGVMEDNPDKDIEEAKPVILLVEDNKELRQYIAGELSKKFSVAVACDGLDGHIQALELIPDLIISDLMMPGLSGFELCRKIKTDERSSHIPVILLTAKQSDENKMEGFNLGADDYISKPFNSDLLLVRIKNILDSRKRLRAIFSNKPVAAIPDSIATELDKVFIKKATLTVQRNLSSLSFQSDDLAEALHVSRRQLYRKLKAITDKTVHDFITQIRLEKSIELLKTGEFTIAQIADKVGFSEAANFSRAFTRHYKVSPKKYVAETRD